MIESIYMDIEIETILPYECFVGRVVINDRNYEFNFTSTMTGSLDEMMAQIRSAKKIVKKLFRTEALTVRNGQGNVIPLNFKKFCTFFHIIFDFIMKMSEENLKDYNVKAKVRMESVRARMYQI